jgi:pentapeptide repeat protein/ion channel
MVEDPLSGYEELDSRWFEEKFGRKPRCNQAQLELLRKCSDKKDMAEWNEWCEGYAKVWLEGAYLENSHLEKANLMSAYLKAADLTNAHMMDVDISDAELECARLLGAHLEAARISNAHLKGANLIVTHLEGADLRDANLEGVSLFKAHLEGADFDMAIVDGGTSFAHCTVDKNTDFSGVGMAGCRMSPGLRDTLEYNIRRTGWAEWCANGGKWRRLVRLFWWTSDYGRSTGRIAVTFLILSVTFGLLYWGFELCEASIVQNLSKVGNTDVPGWLVPFRAQYFSIVTMTTLGFGDMHADPLSLVGHAVLAFQVILGYVLLGALICRLGILFQGHGPPVKFSPEWTGRRWDDPEPQPGDDSADGDPAT